ncbi:type I toxin-antitoxin system Fst family toxin [Lactococcus lactis]
MQKCLREGVRNMLLQLFVSVVAPLVVGVIIELVKDWLKNRHKRH